jgi:hypothetical protein
MSFLPLAGSMRTEENRHMHPYAIDLMVDERRQELHRLAGLDAAARQLSVPGWRRRAGRSLAALAVAVGVPPAHRPATRGRIDAALCLEPPC